MSAFALVDFEGKVQIGDKTRISASKSFAAKNDTAITDVTIKPEDAETAVSVFVLNDPDKWYLDWAYSNMDYDVGGNGAVISWERGALSFNMPVTPGTYSLSALATQIASDMNTVDALGSYTCSYDSVSRKMTITSGSSIKIYPLWMLGDLGFDEILTGTRFVSNPVEFVKKKVTVEITTGSLSTKEVYVKVYDEVGDSLFSNDQDLIVHEPNILGYLIRGRSSFLDFHRNAQAQILDWLWNNGYSKMGSDGLKKRLTKWDLLDYQDVQTWAVFMTLRLIFQSVRNAKDDVFKEKAKLYEAQESDARQTAALKIDVNADKRADQNEMIHTWSGSLFRR